MKTRSKLLATIAIIWLINKPAIATEPETIHKRKNNLWLSSKFLPYNMYNTNEIHKNIKLIIDKIVVCCSSIYY